MYSLNMLNYTLLLFGFLNASNYRCTTIVFYNSVWFSGINYFCFFFLLTGKAVILRVNQQQTKLFSNIDKKQQAANWSIAGMYIGVMIENRQIGKYRVENAYISYFQGEVVE